MGQDLTSVGALRRSAARYLSLAAALIVIGVGMAFFVQHHMGFSVRDVRFTGADGTTFSALVYKPRTATPDTPAPGILAVHGYINTRETQSAFAIEFARRGYVVVALDQRGHGYSGGAATAKGFGGPEGLTFLRSLPFVNKDEIGLEGHSMGGWTILAAAAAMPDAYKAMVLEGSSTGKPFAAPGTPTWPRNLALVYSRFDEFAPLMWGAPTAATVGETAKLKALFGTDATVARERLYGDIAAGTGRMLHQPLATHPGDHISKVAVGEAADWFARTLKGGTPRPVSDQMWWWKEAGTGLFLAGIGALMLGLFDLLLSLRGFAGLRAVPVAQATRRDGRWWARWLTLTLIAPVTFFLLPISVSPLKPSALFPQAITNWMTVWALANVAIGLGVGALIGGRAAGAKPAPARWGLSLALAVGVLAGTYGVVTLAGLVNVDARFWVVALKPLGTPEQGMAVLTALIPFTLFVGLAFRALAALSLPEQDRLSGYSWGKGALAAGFLALTGGQYLWLFATGALPVPFLALNTIVAIQFVPVLGGLAVLAVHAWRRTGGYVAASLIGGGFVAWYVVAGTATHFVG